jgi:hypothetical protein
LQADHQVGAEDYLPPALDSVIVSQAVIGPAEFIRELLVAIRNPGAQAIVVAKGVAEVTP